MAASRRPPYDAVAGSSAAGLYCIAAGFGSRGRRCDRGAASAAEGGRALYVKPRLAVLDLTPLTVRGYSFKARERVTVTLDGGKRGTKRVQATRQGRFTASFSVAPVIGCQTVTIRAVGSLGSRAFRQVPRPDCREP